MDEEKELIIPETGLTAQQVQEHLEAGLGAGLPADSGRSEKEIILRHSLTFFNLVFIVLAVLLIVGKSTVMNMGFLGVVVINTVIGIFQEIRAKRAVDKLTLVASQQVRTLRDGVWTQVRSDLLVQDDVVEFSSPRIVSTNLHGTGCTLSSAIAAFLAEGLGLEVAVARAKGVVDLAIRNAAGLRLGHGNGALWLGGDGVKGLT